MVRPMEMYGINCEVIILGPDESDIILEARLCTGYCVNFEPWWSKTLNIDRNFMSLITTVAWNHMVRSRTSYFSLVLQTFTQNVLQVNISKEVQHVLSIPSSHRTPEQLQIVSKTLQPTTDGANVVTCVWCVADKFIDIVAHVLDARARGEFGSTGTRTWLRHSCRWRTELY